MLNSGALANEAKAIYRMQDVPLPNCDGSRLDIEPLDDQTCACGLTHHCQSTCKAVKCGLRVGDEHMPTQRSCAHTLKAQFELYLE